MTIYFVRHGDVDNPKRILYGRLPGFHLSKLGKVRAAGVAQMVFTDKLVAAIYHSPLERTAETAQIIRENMKTKPPLVADERLIEVDAGPLVGRSKDTPEHREREKGLPAWFNKYVTESANGIQKRVVNLVEEVRRLYPQQEVIFVSHADTIALGILALQGLSLPEQFDIDVDYASVYEVLLNGKAECRLLYKLR